MESYDQSTEDRIDGCSFEVWHKIPQEVRDMYEAAKSMVDSIQQAENDLKNAKKKYNVLLKRMDKLIKQAKEEK